MLSIKHSYFLLYFEWNDTSMVPNDKGNKYNKEIDSNLKKVIYFQLIGMVKADGKIMPGSYSKVARMHGVAPRQVGRAYRQVLDAIKEYKAEHGNETPIHELPDALFESKRSNCKRPPKYDREELANQIKSIPMKERKTYRLMHAATGVSLGLAQAVKKRGVLEEISCLPEAIINRGEQTQKG